MRRYTLFPLQDEKAFEFYKLQESASWTADELDFLRDRNDYERARPEEKRLIDTILAFFLPGDGMVSTNLICRFLPECVSYEEQLMFVSQLRIEAIHAETYALAAMTFVRSAEKLADFIRQAEETPCILAKTRFMEEWMLSDRPRAERMVAFACAEGIFFCSLFAIIFWFRKGDSLNFPNFIAANQLILRDEALHRDFGCYIYQKELREAEARGLPSPCPPERAREIVMKSVEVEDMFIDYLLPEPLENLSAEKMKEYVRFIADLLLAQMGLAPVYDISTNPLGFMHAIAVEGKTNFYEQRNTSYQRQDLAETLNWRKRTGTEPASGDAYNNPEDVDF